jgi:hypothetical protein
MFAESLMRTIAGAQMPALDRIARAIWAAHGSGVISDEDAQRAAEALRARQEEARAQIAPSRQNAQARPIGPRRPRSPDRQASIERRRRLSASGPLPPHLAARFTTSEQAVLRIVGDECRDRGVCALHLEAIAARAGTCRTVVQNALRMARRLGLVDLRERRRRGQRSLTNIIRIVSAEWRAWLVRGGGFRKLNTTDTAASKGLGEGREPAGFGARWQRAWRPYDPGGGADPRWRRR